MAVSRPVKGGKQWEKERGVKRPAKGKPGAEDGSRKRVKRTDAPPKATAYKNSNGATNGQSKHRRAPVEDEFEAFEDESDDLDDGDGGIGLDSASNASLSEGSNEIAEPKQKRTRTTSSNKPSYTKPAANTQIQSSKNSREAHQAQKLQTRLRREAKPHATALADAKQAWESLRAPNQDKQTIRKNAVALLEQVSGRAPDFVLKHDGARLFQAAFRHAKPVEKRGLAQELKGTFRTMAESAYGKHALDKILSNGDAETKALVVSEFAGHVRGMIRHPHAGWALDDAYRGAATKAQKARLLREWYGTEYAVLEDRNPAAAQDNGIKANDEVTADLAAILAANPEKRGPAMRHLLEMITLLVQKKTWRYEMLHDAMLQYFIALPPTGEEWESFLELLQEDDEPGTKSNLALVLSETRSGSRLLALAFARYPAKGRKLLLRKLKDHVESLAASEHGYLPLLAALECTDDTVLTTKSIYGELIAPWKAASTEDGLPVLAMQSRGGRALLSLPFAHKPSLVLTPPDAEVHAEIQAHRAETSKKDAGQRSSELATFILPRLVSAISVYAADLLSNKFTAVIVQEVLLNSPLATEQVVLDPALDELVRLLAGDASEEETTAIDSPAALRVVKMLVLAGWYSPEEDTVQPAKRAPGFAEKLVGALKGNEDGEDVLIKWATGVRAFLVEALVRTSDLKEGKLWVKQVLNGSKATIEQCAAGAESVEKQATEGKKEKPRKKKAVKKDAEQASEEDAATAAATASANMKRVAAKGAQAILAALAK